MCVQQGGKLRLVLTPDIRDKSLWLIVLLPGFVTIGTARLASNLPGLSDFQLGVLFFVASGVNAGIALGIAHAFYLCRGQTVLLSDLAKSKLFIFGVFLISICMGIILAVSYENAWLNRGVQYLLGREVLPKASQHDTLEALLRSAHSIESFDDRRTNKISRDVKVLRLHLDRHDSQVVGMRARWNSTGEEIQLYLSPACIESGGKMTAVSGSGVWVSLKAVVRIDFLDLREIGCIRDLLPKGGEPIIVR